MALHRPSVAEATHMGQEVAVDLVVVVEVVEIRGVHHHHHHQTEASALS